MRNPFRKRRKKEKTDSDRQPPVSSQQGAENDIVRLQFRLTGGDWKDAERSRPVHPSLSDYSSEILSLDDASEDVLWESDDGQYQSNEEPTFKKHKLDCDSCGSPLRVLAGKLAVCDFCQAQYYLEGYDPDIQPRLPQTNDGYGRFNPATPYWINGGVSARRILTNTPHPWK